jgi:hypothetical protein
VNIVLADDRHRSKIGTDRRCGGRGADAGVLPETSNLMVMEVHPCPPQSRLAGDGTVGRYPGIAGSTTPGVEDVATASCVKADAPGAANVGSPRRSHGR